LPIKRYTFQPLCKPSGASTRRLIQFMFVLLLFIWVPQTSYSQFSPQKPFSYFDFGFVYGSISINDDNYGTRWSPSNFIGATVRTDFYAGEVGIRLFSYTYESKTVAGLTVDATNFGFFWDTPPIQLRNVSFNSGIYTGVHGTYATSSVDEIVNKAGHESELILGVQSTVSWHIHPVILFSSVSYEKVYNHYRLHQLYASAGIRVRITTPNYVREFLK
jgi:hypothetical protein